jgi:hypothetical protein
MRPVSWIQMAGPMPKGMSLPNNPETLLGVSTAPLLPWMALTRFYGHSGCFEGLPIPSIEIIYNMPVERKNLYKDKISPQ